MSKILLDYFFPISSIQPVPAASTAFLRQVCVVVKPKVGVETGVITLCTAPAQVAALTDNTDVIQLFNAGMSRVFILPSDDLDLAEVLEDKDKDFYTFLVSSDFSDAEITGTGSIESEPAVKAQVKIQDILFRAQVAGLDGNDIEIVYADEKTDGSAEVASVVGDVITVDIEDGVTTAAAIAAAILASSAASALVEAIVDFGDNARPQDAQAGVNLAGGDDAVVGVPDDAMDLGTYSGVVGVYSNDKALLAAQAVIEKRVAFYGTVATKARNMFFAFGKILSNQTTWTNQQYIQMPFADDVDTLGEANSLFDDKVSFVLSDSEFGNRLSLFAAGGGAVAAPYIKRNFEIDMQSKAIQYVSANQPQYTIKQATLLEDELTKVIDNYIERELITEGSVSVTLEQANFVATGRIRISEPTALWRVFGEVRQA
jgi:hypothetical protein